MGKQFKSVLEYIKSNFDSKSSKYDIYKCIEHENIHENNDELLEWCINNDKLIIIYNLIAFTDITAEYIIDFIFEEFYYYLFRFMCWFNEQVHIYNGKEHKFVLSSEIKKKLIIKIIERCNEKNKGLSIKKLCMIMIIFNKDYDILKQLIEEGFIDLRIYGSYLLTKISYEGDETLDYTKYLVEKGVWFEKTKNLIILSYYEDCEKTYKFLKTYKKK